MGKFTKKETVDAILWDSRSMDITQLHQKYGMKKGTLRALLYRNKLKPAKPDPNRFLIPKEKFMEVLANGWLSTKELCERLDASYSTIMRSLKAHGIVKGRKPSVRHRLREGSRIFKVLGYIMANPEMPHEAVATQFLCTREFVGQVEAMARQEGIIK
jgi:hypothetical protein